jgi:hypothetical protein
MYECGNCNAVYNTAEAMQNIFRCRACKGNLHRERLEVEPDRVTASECREAVEQLCMVEDVKENVRGNGGSTSYYELPEGATELKHLIKHKKMEHGIGEAFCALYRLNDNGEYKRNLIKAKFYIENELEWYEKNKSVI